MEFMQLLSSVPVSLYGQTFDIDLNWIGNLIRLLITAVGSVGVGIILFSLILKVIVLPFDVYQRISMRKQNLKMKENQEKMEKLQKQYANNKEMYNQKVMEMYKESGISMFSSCLPMILSMVIFIVAINAFNAYAQYANVQNYNTMVKAYNAAIVSYAPDLNEIAQDNSGITVTDDGSVVIVKDADKPVFYTVAYQADYAADNYAYVKNAEKSYAIDTAVALADNDIKAYVDGKVAAGTQESDALSSYFYEKAQEAVVVAYETEVYERTSFLWIKNIWATDASYKHPVLDYTSFQSEISREEFNVNGEEVDFGDLTTTVYDSDSYNHITAKLDKQKDQANGYYILIVLSIGTILLQQWISMRANKEQQKYGSVDGQGASQQKMMLVIMTVMFAVFSFMYSSAFSIYMIMSNILSLLSTLIINKFVDKRAEKAEEKAFREKYDRAYSSRAAKTAGLRTGGKNAKNDKNANKKK
ncbi:MAG: YidC/Oxa1 family membrane protein insertase [Clostridia bacterium]|nr:YidC/Oxa1 family membrane protein insertase [Clostridia bacterium]